jgi:hypothetical protein
MPQFSLARGVKDSPALTSARPAIFTGPNMTLAIKNPVRCAALVVVFLLAGARGELTVAQDLAPDPYFSPMRPLKKTGAETQR